MEPTDGNNSTLKRRTNQANLMTVGANENGINNAIKYDQLLGYECYDPAQSLLQFDGTPDGAEAIGTKQQCILYVAVIALFLFALINILTTFAILAVLRIGYGMDSLELITMGKTSVTADDGPGYLTGTGLVRFLKTADFKSVKLHNGRIGGFVDYDLDISATNNKPVIVEAGPPSAKLETSNKYDYYHGGRYVPTTTAPDTSRTHFSVGVNGEVAMQNVDTVSVTNPVTGKTIFTTDYADFQLPRSVKNLHVNQVRTKHISSAIDRPLAFLSDSYVKLKGNEGTRIAGREIVWAAAQDVFLKSVNSSIILDGMNGVYLNLERFQVSDPREDAPRMYKVCVCRSNGRLFRVPVTLGNYNCANAVTTGRISPCA